MNTLSRRGFLAASAATLSAAAIPSLLMPVRQARADAHKVITAGKRVIEVKGKAANVFGLTQADGSSGLVMNAGDNFRVTLKNLIGEPTVIHWHGLTPPWQQDGVAGISQEPIPDGGSHDYDFPVARPGTFWMHSHFGLQEQLMLAAPLIVRDPAEAGQDMQEVVVLFHDFTFRDPREILAELKAGGHDMGAMQAPTPAAAGHEGHDMSGMSGMSMGSGGSMNMGGTQMDGQPGGMSHLQDVQYDALLANDRTLDDPEVFAVEPGGRVRLRLINGAASTNMWLDLGKLQGKLVAVDGMPVEPIEGSRFEFAVAQRLDIVLELPKEASAWPVFAVQEGGRMRTGVVLAAKGASVGKLTDVADEDFPAVGVELEQKLRAASPLAEKTATRQHTMMLGEGQNYVWTLDGAMHGSDKPLAVKSGDRFELTFMNHTTMSHPMHLHGHLFQVVAVNGKRFAGAMRDTVLVPANMGMVTIAFDADNAGKWALHCHHLYHMAGGMMTSMAYDN
ncbi:multicopper oxidase family protein [Aminobacter aganoensis]|uniref:FtsP/CotA-like multicopper oxidase with cupredoxin domain n=1 Tax=Aminobacter aganoensis TaxID=83264 RepID=A0A7X0FCZ7_9HYPH|nr:MULTISPECIES: multicopper oxidase domain-containing protein [Aminobacter]KQU72794.1 copper oxidase [Aminobacter sp. DSM 101952]MBB6357431.1 FtsP/CotA-like multicopper oxidase with cupredoxin domain [Aminobacter aganoensis]